MKKKRRLEQQVKQGIKEFLWHSLFMLCLVSIMMSNRDPQAFLCSQQIRSDLDVSVMVGGRQ